MYKIVYYNELGKKLEAKVEGTEVVIEDGTLVIVKGTKRVAAFCRWESAVPIEK